MSLLDLLEAAGPLQDLLVFLGQFVILLLVSALLWQCLRVAITRTVPAGATRAATLRVVRMFTLALAVSVALALGVANAILYWRSGHLTGDLVRVYQHLPAESAARIGLLMVEWGAIALATTLLSWLLRRGLRRAHTRVRGWERLTENDAAVDAFFGFLGTAIAVGLWLFALALALSLLPATAGAASVTFTALRAFLIFAVGLLLVRATAAIVESLDALSARFATPTSPLQVYVHLRGLIPLFRRCVEAAIWLAVASLILLQVRPVAPLAYWGPRLIAVVAIFFFARVLAEIVTLAVRRAGAGGPELTDLERQQRATLIPLIASLGRLVVYFVAFILMLSVVGLNPLPLLAGAGILGVVVGFGAQPVINDLVSGFFVLAESQFLVGDYIEVGASRGVVEAISLRTTTLRDPAGQLHILRNGQLIGVVNYSKRYTFAVVDVEMPQDANLDTASRALQEAGERLQREQPDVLESTIVEGVEKLDRGSLTLRTKTKVRPGSHGQVAREYRRLALEGLKQAGIAPYAPQTSR